MQKPPLIAVTTLLFSLTFLAAITVVPWYGITHGFDGLCSQYMLVHELYF